MIARERLATFLPDARPLIADHCARLGRGDCDLDEALLAALEADGRYLLWTARAGGRLLGYAAFVLQPDLYRRGATLAWNEALYVADNGGGWLGSRLLRHAVDEIAAMGVETVHVSSPAARPIDAVLRRQGFAPVETAWARAA